LEEGMTETTPAKAYQKVSFTFYIGDVDSGILFSSKNLTRKGVGDNKDQAYLNAVKQIQTTDPAFKRLIEEAKIRIVETLKAREDAGEFDKDSYDINWW
jgi:7,8-dihydro-6-hydroxymethylpterin-pyrophosphokinase